MKYSHVSYREDRQEDHQEDRLKGWVRGGWRGGFLCLVMLVCGASCKPKINGETELLVDGNTDVISQISFMLAQGSTSQEIADAYKRMIDEIRALGAHQQKVHEYNQGKLDRLFVDIKVGYLESKPNGGQGPIPTSRQVKLKMRLSDYTIQQVNQSSFEAGRDKYPAYQRAPVKPSPHGKGFDPNGSYDCITKGCLIGALKDVLMRAAKGEFRGEKIALNTDKYLARLILMLAEGVRFHSVSQQVYQAFNDKKTPPFPPHVIENKPIQNTWYKLSEIKAKVVAVRTLTHQRFSWEVERGKAQKSSAKGQRSKGVCLTQSLYELPDEVADYFDFSGDGFGLVGSCGMAKPDAQVAKRVKAAVQKMEQSVVEMQAAQAAIHSVPLDQKAAAVKRFNQAKKSAAQAISITSAVIGKVRVVGAKLVPIAGAALEVAGLAFGIAEAVDMKKQGGSDAAAAAAVLGGWGLAGAIPALISCTQRGCNPNEKAAAFFQGFFGIDFTAKAACADGFEPVGSNICRSIQCPPGYRDDGATCFKDARITEADNGQCPWYDKCGLTLKRGCSSCPPGYWNDGCTCRQDPSAVGKTHYWSNPS